VRSGAAWLAQTEGTWAVLSVGNFAPRAVEGSVCFGFSVRRPGNSLSIPTLQRPSGNFLAPSIHAKF